MIKAPYIKYVCVFKLSETTGPTETFPGDRGKDGKLVQTIKAICCYSLLSTTGGRGYLAGMDLKF